jgi:2,3-bisphosphoglycerate-independent phosphoglycerate mutase
MMAAAGVPVVIHAITDGRDVPPKSAGPFSWPLAPACPRARASARVIGRYFAMDRDNRWDRVSRPTTRWCSGEGEREADRPPPPAVAPPMPAGETDEFIRHA